MIPTEGEGQKLFAYLVQGTSSNLVNFNFLQTANSDLYLLSYDKPIAKAPTGSHTIFLPNSTWAEGRNTLLQYAINGVVNYRYYIFLDDDVEIISGSFPDFESELIKFNPMMGIPLGDQIKETFRYDDENLVHHPVAFDQIVQAYHRDAVTEGIAIPYETIFDSESWWYSCQINQYLTLKYYRGRCAQFNKFQIRNSAHQWKIGKVHYSNYQSGVTKHGLKKCAQFIEEKYGSQPKLINSLFHPRFTPRERYAPSLRWIKENRKNMDSLGIARKAGSLFLAKITKLYFQLKRTSNLITFDEFSK
jgi:hypothetical protein